jgi:hypothetical protein
MENSFDDVNSDDSIWYRSYIRILWPNQEDKITGIIAFATFIGIFSTILLVIASGYLNNYRYNRLLNSITFTEFQANDNIVRAYESLYPQTHVHAPGNLIQLADISRRIVDHEINPATAVGQTFVMNTSPQGYLIGVPNTQREINNFLTHVQEEDKKVRILGGVETFLQLLVFISQLIAAVYVLRLNKLQSRPPTYDGID